MKTLTQLCLIFFTLFAQAEVVNIPDANFKAKLIAVGVDLNKDGQIQLSEAQAVKKLFLFNSSISDLTGIEAFTTLTSLDCSGNQLTKIDISRNTVLTELTCMTNQLHTLDVSRNPALTSLICLQNELTALDVGSNTALAKLNCSANKLTALDISRNMAVTNLDCSKNKLSVIDISRNKALKELNCSDNYIKALDISGNTALTELTCWYNGLTALDLSRNMALTRLSFGGNELTTLDVSGNTALTKLDCDFNNLKTLDITRNTALQNLSCFKMPNLKTICVNNAQLKLTKTRAEKWVKDATASWSTTCSTAAIIGSVKTTETALDLIASDEDESDDEYIANLEYELDHPDYEVVKNDKNLAGLVRIKDKKLIIAYKYSDIILQRADKINYVSVYDSLKREGIFSIKDNKVLVPCNYKEIALSYHDFYWNDEKEIEKFCGFEAVNADGNTTTFYTPNGKKLISTNYSIELSPMGKYQTDTIIGYLNNPELKSVGYFLYNAKTGALIQNKEFAEVNYISSDKFLIILTKAGKYGVINCINGIFAVPAQYDSIESTPLGYIVYQNKAIAFLNKKGIIVVPFGTYDKISTETGWANSEKVNPQALCVSKNNKWGCVNKQNKIILPIVYDRAFQYRDTMWISKNHKYGAISSQGKEICAFEYDSVVDVDYYYQDLIDYYDVKNNGKWGCINKSGKIILPVQFDRPVEYADTMWASKEGKWGCIGKDLNQIVEFKFDTAVYRDFKFNSKGLTCFKSNQEIHLTRQGNDIPARKTAPGKAGNSGTHPAANSSSAKSVTPQSKVQELYYAIYNNDMVKFSQIMQAKPDLTSVYDNKPPVYHVALLSHISSH